MKTLPHRPISLGSRFAVLYTGFVLALASVASAVTYTVTTATDHPVIGVAIVAGTGVISSGAGNGQVTLRSAVIAANMSGVGPHIINVPAGLGSYNLSQANPSAPASTATNGFNDLQVGSDLSTVTLNGTGGTAKIVQTIAGNDVITTGFKTGGAAAVVNLTLDHLEITGGTFTGIFTGMDDGTHRSSTTITNCSIHNNSNGDPAFGQGGAIQNTGGILTISNTTFANNSATNSSSGQGGAIFYSLPNASGAFSVGNLSVANCTFNSNTAAIGSGFPAGGAIFMSLISTGTTDITGCTFSGNQATAGGDGGAIATANATGRTLNIARNQFISNQVTNAAGHGGAVDVNSGVTNINFNRFSGNTATTAANGRAIYHPAGNGDAVSANDNWWTLNTGPTANDTAGTVTRTTWLQLRNIANPATVQISAATLVTADLLGRNSGGPIAPANLNGLPTFPVPAGTIFTNPQRGTLTGISTQFVNGQATVTFNANGPAGLGGVDATADSQTVTAAINVAGPASITSADNTAFTVGSFGSFTVMTSGAPAVTTVNATGALPTGVNFVDNGNGTATLSGTPAAGTGGVYPLTITASNGVPPNATQAFTLTVREKASITSPNSKTFTVGVAGTFTVTTTGGFPTPTLGETGALPSGVTFTDNTDGTATLAGTPDPGTNGSYPLTINATNTAGTTNQPFTLTVVVPLDPTASLLFAKGGPVPGAGTPGGPPADAVFSSFGVPAINDNDTTTVAFAAKWKSPTGSGAGIFAGGPVAVVVKTGDTAPDATGAPLSGVTFKSFKDPVLARNGSIAFLAKLTGDSTTDTALFTNAGGTLRLVARENATLAGTPVDSQLKSVTSASVSSAGGETWVVFTGRLRIGSGGAPGPGGVTSVNDTGAWRWKAGSGMTTSILQEGSVLSGVGTSPVKTFRLLKTAGGSPGQSRGQSTGANATFQVAFADKTQALVDTDEGGASKAFGTGEATVPGVTDATWKAFGPPAVSGSAGDGIAFLSKLNANLGGVLSADAKRLFFLPTAGTGASVKVTDAAPTLGAGTAFSTFKDPVLAPSGNVFAFLGTAKGGAVTKTTDTGIYWQPAGGSLALAAREGAHPPDSAIDAQWKTFKSVASTNKGPIFVAKLALGAGGAPGPGGITSLSDTGLWAVTTSGTTRKLLQEGDTLDTKIVKTFTVLTAASGSQGVRRSFTNSGTTIVRINFTDGGQALYTITVP